MSNYSASLTAVCFAALVSVGAAAGLGLMLKSTNQGLNAVRTETQATLDSTKMIRAAIAKQREEKAAQFGFLDKWGKHFGKEDSVSIRSRLAELRTGIKSGNQGSFDLGNDISPGTETIAGTDVPAMRAEVSMDGAVGPCFNAIGELAVRFPSARLDEFTVSPNTQAPEQIRVLARLTIPQLGPVAK